MYVMMGKALRGLHSAKEPSRPVAVHEKSDKNHHFSQCMHGVLASCM